MLLITVRPGPELCVWRDGQEVVRIPLDLNATLELIRGLVDQLPNRK